MKQTTRWGMQRQKQWLRWRRRLRWRLRQGRQVAGGQTLSSFAARRGPEQMKLKCEAGWQHLSFDIDIEQHPITTATTSTHTHVNLYVYRCIQCWITQLISVTWFITFCVCFRCMSQTTFNFNFIYLHFCAFHTRKEERGNEEWGWPTSRWPAANAPMQLQLRHCRRTRNEERGASWAAVAGQTRLHLKIKMFYLWDRLGNVLLAQPRVICIKRRTQRALRCQLLKHSA